MKISYLAMALSAAMCGLSCDRGLRDLPRTCDPAKQDCAGGQLCSRGVREPFAWGHCIGDAAAADQPYHLPLVSSDGVKCSHGALDEDGTHSYMNSLYAIDLATPYDGAPGVVVAGRDGVVSALHSACLDPGKAVGHADDCGRGFGNWVRVAHFDGTASFYAHLAVVAVELGQTLSAGQVIGREGTTGRAGFRHLHFAVQRPFDTGVVEDNAWQSVDFAITARAVAATAASRALTSQDIHCGDPDTAVTLFTAQSEAHDEGLPVDVALPSSSVGPRR